MKHSLDAALDMLMAVAFGAALWWLLGCGAGAVRREPPPAPTPWCFRFGVRDGAAGLVLALCAPTSWDCERAARIAAGVPNVRDVGECR